MNTFSLYLLFLAIGCVAGRINEVNELKRISFNTTLIDPYTYSLLNTQLNPSGEIRRTLINENRLSQKSPCVVVFSDALFLDHRVEERPMECELQSADKMNANKFKIVTVRGLSTKWAKKHNVESGVTTLFASNAVIDDDSNELIIPTNATIKVNQ
jgi:hypothetical protein